MADVGPVEVCVPDSPVLVSLGNVRWKGEGTNALISILMEPDGVCVGSLFTDPVD